MATKMIATPQITHKGLPGFLLWARRESPVLYAALLKQFPEVQDFEDAAQAEGVSGLLDVFSSIGSSLSSAASGIASFVTKNAVPLLVAAAPVAVALKQASVAKTQIKLANAQQAPARTALTVAADGSVISVPIQQTTGAAQPLSYYGMPAKASAPLPWGLIAGIGAGAIGLMFLLNRR